MIQSVKHLCLIFTLLAWMVSPLPECYLTKPNCPQRNNNSCQALNHHQTAKATPAQAAGCAACLKGGQASPVSHDSSNQSNGRLLMVGLSLKFLPQQQADVAHSLQASGLVPTERMAILPAARSWSAAPVGLSDPIPILQRTQTLLI